MVWSTKNCYERKGHLAGEACYIVDDNNNNNNNTEQFLYSANLNINELDAHVTQHPHTYTHDQNKRGVIYIYKWDQTDGCEILDMGRHQNCQPPFGATQMENKNVDKCFAVFHVQFQQVFRTSWGKLHCHTFPVGTLGFACTFFPHITLHSSMFNQVTKSYASNIL